MIGQLVQNEKADWLSHNHIKMVADDADELSPIPKINTYMHRMKMNIFGY